MWHEPYRLGRDAEHRPAGAKPAAPSPNPQALLASRWAGGSCSSAVEGRPQSSPGQKDSTALIRFLFLFLFCVKDKK